MTTTAHFTEFELDVSELKRSKLQLGPFPKGWSRVKVEFPHFDKWSKLVNWCLLNIPGRFGYINCFPHAILYFEDHSDGTLFRMLEGETACLEPQRESF